MADDLFGWDLIYRSVENDLLKKGDLIVAFTHWFLVKNGFSCIGNGSSKTLNGDEVKSEVLSPDWNKRDDYNIRYLHDDRLYLLMASVYEDEIIFNFLGVNGLKVSSCLFKIDEVVKFVKGDLTTTIPDYKNVLQTLRRDLLEPVFTKSTTSAVGTQTAEQVTNSNRQDPLRVLPRRPPVPQPPRGDILWDPRGDPLSVGRSDLDPFASGGGMIFDPLGHRTERRDPIGPGPSFPGGLPRGAVPPGARFDPFTPPGTGRGGRSDPDPDHLPPPGYDDMFM